MAPGVTLHRHCASARAVRFSGAQQLKRAAISIFVGITLLALGIVYVGYRAYRHYRRQRTIPQMLADLNRHLDPRTYPFMNAARADLLRARLKNPELLQDPDR